MVAGVPRAGEEYGSCSAVMNAVTQSWKRQAWSSEQIFKPTAKYQKYQNLPSEVLNVLILHCVQHQILSTPTAGQRPSDGAEARTGALQLSRPDCHSTIACILP